MLLRLVLGLVALGLPIAAFWLATSTGLLLGLGRGPAIAAAAIMVLGIPLVWDIWAEARHARKNPPVERITTRGDRIRLRVLAISMAFSASMLLGMNRTMTHAVAERGDWFLDGANTPFARDVRRGLVDVAIGIQRTFGPRGDAPLPLPAPPIPSATATTAAENHGSPTISVDTPADTPANTPTGAPRWPLPPTPHPAVVGLTDTRTRSIAAVAAHLKAAIPDPWQRVKAYHDFAIRHLRFDVAALHTPPPPSTQTAQAVFESRSASARGYANLVAALGAAAGDTIEVISGRTRAMSTAHVAFDHAWNAVDIGGAWHFVDAARDAGVLLGDDFAPGYGTTWLFAPPEVMAIDHLPDDPVWNPPGAPTELDAFLAGTGLSARAVPFGLKPSDLPTRIVAGRADFELQLSNPRNITLLTTAWAPDEGVSATCSPPTREATARVACQLGRARRWMVVVHAATDPAGPFMPVGLVRVLLDGTL